MTRLAIIGTRSPSEEQKSFVTNYVAKLKESVEIISGCAVGIDELALREGYQRNLNTIGVIPWKTYNREVQRYCQRVISIETAGEQERKEAFQSVIKYHPMFREAPRAGKRNYSKAVFLLHARNYLIVKSATAVLALPKDSTGGTMQGIRVTKDLGIPCLIIN